MIEDSIDRPFSAGPHATIHPGSLVVDFRLTQTQLRRFNERYEQWDKSSDRRKAAGVPESFEEMPVEARDFLSCHAHELDHRNRFLGTSFGILCDAVRDRWLARAGQLVQERAARKATPMFPGRLYRLPPGSSFEESLEKIEGYARAGSAAEANFVGLSDLLTALVDDVPPARFASALWGLTDGRPDLIPGVAGRVDVTKPTCAAFPTTDEAGGHLGLSARHVLELFAIREQGNSLINMDAPLRAVNDLLNETRDEYSLAHLAWCEVFPPTKGSRTANDPAGRPVVEYDWVESFPFELFVAADLALWPPFLPDSSFPPGSVPWTDLQPGRRFVRAIRSLKRLALPLPRFDAKRQNDMFLDLQSRICADLGWLTPQRIAALWHTHLGTLAHSPWPVLDGPSTYRLENARLLLGERQKRPAEIALNNVDVQSLGGDSAAAWVVTRDDGGRDIRPMSRSEFTALVPFWVLEGVQQLVCPDRALFGGAFDPLFRKTAADLTAAQLAKAGGWEAETVRRFQAETQPVYNL